MHLGKLRGREAGGWAVLKAGRAAKAAGQVGRRAGLPGRAGKGYQAMQNRTLTKGLSSDTQIKYLQNNAHLCAQKCTGFSWNPQKEHVHTKSYNIKVCTNIFNVLHFRL